TGELHQSLQGSEGEVESVAFAPDGRLLATGSLDNTVRLWDVSTSTEGRQAGGGLLQPLRGHEGKVLDVAFSADGRWLASAAEDKAVRLWDAQTGQEVHVLKADHMVRPEMLAFSPDGRRLAASGDLDAEKVLLWDTTTGELLYTLQSHV